MTVHTQSSKIFVVTELYYPEETSTGYFLTKIAEGLATKFPVNVLCVQPTYSSRGIKAAKNERLNGVDINRCTATAFNKDKIFFRLINMLTISFSFFLQLLLRLSSKDRVLVVTNPPILPYLIAFACLLKRARYFLLVHDAYPEVLVAAGITSPGSVMVKIGSWFSNKLYSSSFRIIVLGRDMRQLVLKKIAPQNADKIVIIPNWSDIEDVYPLPRTTNSILSSMNLSSKWVITYAGNMGRTHGLENLINVAKKINGKETNIHFVLSGTGAKRSWLEAAVKKEGLSNVTSLPSQPRAELNNLLNACDVAIISFIPGMAGVSVPSRMYNVLAAGKPIIAVADATSELALVIKEEGIGWVVPPDQPDLLVETIETAWKQRTSLASMGKKARSAAESKYALHSIIAKYLAIFTDNDSRPLSPSSSQEHTH